VEEKMQPGPRINRRLLLASGTALTALGAASFVSHALAQSAPPKPSRFVVNASGGAMGQAMQDSYMKLFEQRFGIPVVLTSPPDLGKLKAMVESNNVEWNVTEISSNEALRAARLGLLEPIDERVVDRSAYPAAARHKFLLTTSVYSTILGYRTDVFKDGAYPKSWAEFWDVNRFPGPRSMYDSPVDNLEFALLADGVPMDKLYPIDVDRAFKKLDQIKPHVTVWWQTGAQPAQLLADKEVVLSTAFNGRVYTIMKQGAPVGLSWSQGCIKQAYFGIPKGAKDAAWGQQFLEVMTDPQAQSVFANTFMSPGLNPESLKYSDAAVVAYLPTTPENLAQQFWQDGGWWDENVTEVKQRWQRWLIG
jgi:putative spermidine/putrescine transport system substrate-binding protein